MKEGPNSLLPFSVYPSNTLFCQGFRCSVNYLTYGKILRARGYSFFAILFFRVIRRDRSSNKPFARAQSLLPLLAFAISEPNLQSTLSLLESGFRLSRSF